MTEFRDKRLLPKIQMVLTFCMFGLKPGDKYLQIQTEGERGTMERFLLIFAASALSVVSSRPARQYHVILDPKNWTEAQRYCREKFTDLASVDNTDDVDILMNMGLPTTLEPWIGLYYDGGTWQWSMTDKDFFKPDGANYRNWNPGEPSSGWNNAQCVYMKVTGLWDDSSCEWPRKPMCSDVRGSNVTFVHIDTSMTWPAAQKYCREHYTDLASVRSSAENQKIMDLKPAEEDVWLGLSKTSWTWSNGSTTTFHYWNDGEPNDQIAVCVMMLFKNLGKWVDSKCGQLRPFICYEEFLPVFKQILRLKLVGNPSLDPNDPDVSAALQQQLLQKLKDQNVNGNVNLNWMELADGKIFHQIEEENQT
ncbi:hypothetical protein OJAV_G00070490 [Oryzias javanicus]|uniref:C-type lectin domain-containing protein n=1 Tax=Oryzias javanicus TaxID=123683 RepID=A0A437D8T3_ORYJA|nr:hypothetical protein OJAV_G00070490 [Oryzias javanicus]